MRRTKPWGIADLVFQSEFLYLEKIWINQDGKSSIHLHNRKFNTFIVEFGKLRIYTDGADWLLTESQEVTIGPKVLHQFVAFTNVIAYEVYYGPQVDYEDIERFDKWI